MMNAEYGKRSLFRIHHSTFREAVDIHAIDQFKNDPKIKALIRAGKDAAKPDL